MEVLTITAGWLNNHYSIKESPLTRTADDLLPSLAAVYSFGSRINLRASYGKTMARPDFRELSYTNYYDVDERLEVTILRPLEQSYVKNYDLRFEWYPDGGEVISLSFFYKEFEKPVEKISRVKTDQQNYQVFTVNLDAATARGMELNFRKSFGFVAPALANLWLSGNASLIKGNIEYQVWGDKTRERPLQGLAPYLLNASLNYEGKLVGAVVNYTRAGRVLVMAGDYPELDEFENPRNVLDLQVSARFLKERLEVKLNASDLLHEDIIIYRNCSYGGTGNSSGEGLTIGESGYYDLTAHMDYNAGDWVLSRINKGVNFSLSINYKF
jgi:TonB-dependent receptor